MSAAGTVDVIEVEICSPHRIRIMARQKSERDAEAFISMAVARRGTEEHFFRTAPSGIYKDGDVLRVKD